MLERYENVTSIPATKAAGYVNEVTDSIKTVAALGRERETMRVFDVQAKAAPKRGKYLILGSAGFAVGQAMILLMAALIFYWASQRLADGAVSPASAMYDRKETHVLSSSLSRKSLPSLRLSSSLRSRVVDCLLSSEIMAEP